MKAGIERLTKRLEELRQFEPSAITDQYNIPDVERLSAAIDETLVRTFGADSADFDRYRNASQFDNGPHNYAFAVPIADVHRSLARSKARNIALLEQAIDALKERFAEAGTSSNSDQQVAVDKTARSRKVFIVHGHDEGPRESVARFVEKLDFEVIILHERPNKGRTIIAKFREEAAGVGFAVVLMTPDDIGKAKEDAELKSRARQNVIFELGFFIGALRPERVAALVKGDIDLPTDYEGVVYISMDSEDWRTKLAKELQAAHYDIDWNKVMKS
jgi:predicted nucleotide-binding protein